MGMEANEEKEEQKMGDEVGTKVQEALDRREMLEKLEKLAPLLKDVQTIKANQDGISDLCKRFPGLCEKVEKLEKGFEANTAEVKSLCEKFPGLCSTQEKIEERLVKDEAERPKGELGTDLSLDELLQSEKSQENLAKNYMGPAGLLFALERCTGPECEALRQKAKERGINIQVKSQTGMLGAGWHDID